MISMAGLCSPRFGARAARQPSLGHGPVNHRRPAALVVLRAPRTNVAHVPGSQHREAASGQASAPARRNAGTVGPAKSRLTAPPNDPAQLLHRRDLRQFRSQPAAAHPLPIDDGLRERRPTRAPHVQATPEPGPSRSSALPALQPGAAVANSHRPATATETALRDLGYSKRTRNLDTTAATKQP
jgi:hypothetical protein